MKKNIKLSSLKVQSFMTTIASKDLKNVVGGDKNPQTIGIICPTFYQDCITHRMQNCGITVDPRNCI